MESYKANKYFLYLRRSQDAEDRQVSSLDDQEKEMREVAERLGINVIDVIKESQSAKKPGRPYFNEMIARIHAGEADGILCWKINRLARNPVDGGQIQWMLQSQVIKHIQTHSGDYKPTDNVIMMAVELGMANQFVNDLSVDVKRGMKNKAERGWNPQCQLPIGYKHNKGYGKGESEIVEGDDLPVIRNLFTEMLTGSYSASDIHRLSIVYGLTGRTGKPRTLQTIVNTLANEFYFGYYTWNGIRHKGNHQPILTEEEFNRVQHYLGKKGRPTRVNKLDFAFRGPIKCGECGCAVTAEHKARCLCTNCNKKFSCKVQTACPKCQTDMSEMKNPKIYTNVYYHCTKKKKDLKCSQGVIEERELEKLIVSELKDVEINEDFHKWAVAALKDMHGSEMMVQDDTIEVLEKKRKALRSRLDQLFVMRADSEISADEFTKLKGESEIEIHDVEKEQTQLNNRLSEWNELANEYLTFAEQVCARFNKVNNQEKRVILRTLGSTLELRDKKLIVVAPNELMGLSNVYKKIGDDLGRFETKKDLDKQGLSKEKAVAFSTLCAEQDSNLRRNTPGGLQPPAFDRSAIDA